MATLADRVSALATAVRDKINLMVPRLLPAGGAIGQVLTKNGAGNYAAGWQDPGAGTYHPRGVHGLSPMLAAGSHVTQAINASANITIASAANRFYLMPFIPARSMTIDLVAVEVSTAAAGSAQVGIYDSDATETPANLVTGTVANLDTGTTGLKSQAVTPAELVAGQVYWLAVWTSAAPTFRATPSAACLMMNGSAANQIYNHFLATVAFGALPAVAPTAGRALAIASVPRVNLRLA